MIVQIICDINEIIKVKYSPNFNLNVSQKKKNFNITEDLLVFEICMIYSLKSIGGHPNHKVKY